MLWHMQDGTELRRYMGLSAGLSCWLLVRIQMMNWAVGWGLGLCQGRPSAHLCVRRVAA